MAQTQKEANNKPVHHIRLGNVRIAIWFHENDQRTWYNTTFARRYKQGNEWKDSTSFNLVDLPLVAQLASMAASWICAQGSDERESEE